MPHRFDNLTSVDDVLLKCLSAECNIPDEMKVLLATQVKRKLMQLGYISVMTESDMPIMQAEVRIIYGIDHGGEQTVSTTFTADGLADHVPDYFTGLVMFEVAKINFLQRHRIVNDPR